MSSVAKFTAQQADYELILFDGPCVLCQRSVRFVHRFDRIGHYRFCALQSVAGGQLLAELGLEAGYDSSVLLLSNRGGRWQAQERSAAVLGICRSLSFPWPMLGVLRVFPASWLDHLYDLVGQRRQRWFGTCPLPGVISPELAGRFIHGGLPTS